MATRPTKPLATLPAGTKILGNGSLVPAGVSSQRRRRTKTKERTELAIQKSKTSILSRLRRWYAWNAKFHLLKKYVTQHGHSTVPAGLDSVSYPKLGAWVIEQRSALRGDKLKLDAAAAEAQAELDAQQAALGEGGADNADGSSSSSGAAPMTTTEKAAAVASHVAKSNVSKATKTLIASAAAAARFDFAEAAKQDGGSDHHHHGIPHIEKQNGPAAAARRIARLDSIGFDWGETRQSRWERMFALLRKYYEEHGDVLVPSNLNTEKYPRLGVWVVAQRRAYRETVQSQKRTNAAKARVAAATAAHEDSMVAAATTTSTVVPAAVVSDPAADPTIDGQRAVVATPASAVPAVAAPAPAPGPKRHLTPHQVELLDTLGFTWVTTSIRLTRWTKNFHLLRAYQAEFGHTRVPLGFDTAKYPKLGRWVQQQRKAFRKGPVSNPNGGSNQPVAYNRISMDQVAKLNGINFDWTIQTAEEAAAASQAAVAAAVHTSAQGHTLHPSVTPLLLPQRKRARKSSILSAHDRAQSQSMQHPGVFSGTGLQAGGRGVPLSLVPAQQGQQVYAYSSNAGLYGHQMQQLTAQANPANLGLTDMVHVSAKESGRNQSLEQGLGLHQQGHK